MTSGWYQIGYRLFTRVGFSRPLYQLVAGCRELVLCSIESTFDGQIGTTYNKPCSYYCESFHEDLDS